MTNESGMTKWMKKHKMGKYQYVFAVQATLKWEYFGGDYFYLVYF